MDLPELSRVDIVQILLEPLHPYVVYILGDKVQLGGQSFVSVARNGQVVKHMLPIGISGVKTENGKFTLTGTASDKDVIALVYAALEAERVIGHKVFKDSVHFENLSFNDFVTGKKSSVLTINGPTKQVSVLKQIGVTAQFEYKGKPIKAPVKLLTDSYYSIKQVTQYNLLTPKEQGKAWVGMMAHMDIMKTRKAKDIAVMVAQSEEKIREIHCQRMFKLPWDSLTRGQKIAIDIIMKDNVDPPNDTADLIKWVLAGNVTKTIRSLRQVMGRMKASGTAKLTVAELRDGGQARAKQFGACLHWLEMASLMDSDMTPDQQLQQLLSRWALPISDAYVYNCKSCAIQLATVDSRSEVAFKAASGGYDVMPTAIRSAVNEALRNVRTGLKSTAPVVNGMSNAIASRVQDLTAKVTNKNSTPESIDLYRRAYSIICAYAATSAMIVANEHMRWLTVETPKVTLETPKVPVKGGKLGFAKAGNKSTVGFAKKKATVGFAKSTVGFAAPKVVKKSPTAAELLEAKREQRKINLARKKAEEAIGSVDHRRMARAVQKEMPIVSEGYNIMLGKLISLQNRITLSKPMIKQAFGLEYNWARNSLGDVAYTVPTDIGIILYHSFLYQQTHRLLSPKGSPDKQIEKVFGRPLVDILQELELGATIESLLVKCKNAEPFYLAQRAFANKPYKIPGDAIYKEWASTYSNTLYSHDLWKQDQITLKRKLIANLCRFNKKVNLPIIPFAAVYCMTGEVHKLVKLAGAKFATCVLCGAKIDLKTYSAHQGTKLIKDSTVTSVVAVRSSIRGLIAAYDHLCPVEGTHEGRPCKKCKFDNTKTGDPEYRNQYYKRYKDVYMKSRSSLTLSINRKNNMTSATTTVTGHPIVRHIAPQVQKKPQSITKLYQQFADASPAITSLTTALKLNSKSINSLGKSYTGSALDRVLVIRDYYVFCVVSWGQLLKYTKDPLITTAEPWITNMPKMKVSVSVFPPLDQNSLVLPVNEYIVEPAQKPLHVLKNEYCDAAANAILGKMFIQLNTLYRNGGQAFVKAVLIHIFERNELICQMVNVSGVGRGGASDETGDSLTTEPTAEPTDDAEVEDSIWTTLDDIDDADGE